MDRNRVIETFLEAVQINSPTGYEDEMVAWVMQKLIHLGVSSRQDHYGNIVAKVGRGRSVALTAHLDTVEPGVGIHPVISNGVIRSSGNTILGADNKVAVAVLLEVAEIIMERKLDVSLELIFTLSEEVGNMGAVNLDYSLITAKSGFAFDMPGPIGGIVVASPAYNRFDIQLIGKSSHASKPERAANVLEMFTNATHKIKLGRIDTDTVCNIGIVNLNGVRNTVPGRILIGGEVRSFVEEKMVHTTNKIVKTFHEEARTLGGDAIVEVVRENGGYKFDRNHSLVRYAAEVMKKNNMQPKFIESMSCSDSNVFCDLGLTIINISDGSAKTHTTDENVSVESITKLTGLALGLVSESDKDCD